MRANLIGCNMNAELVSNGSLAATITKSASKQTFYTIRFLANHERAADAYRAYAYFRWVDDVLDAETGTKPEKIAFARRERALLDACYRGETAHALCDREEILCELVHHDTQENSGLRMYLRNMMDVMSFDAERRGKLISQTELNEYSRKLATAVTEAMYYFIGHTDASPPHPARYLSVTAAHITHMLRDAYEDVATGYYNIPREYLESRAIAPQDFESRAYCEWVCSRAKLARAYFKQGREGLAQLKNLRLQLAGYAYTSRFEWMLGAIERDRYCLRAAYPERKSLPAGLWMGWSTIASLLASPLARTKGHRPGV